MRGGWKNDYKDLSHAYYQEIQDTLLDGKYLDRNLFENITGTECYKRYTSPFIVSGNGFAVPPPDQWESPSSYANSSLLRTSQGAGQLLELIDGFYNASSFSCKLRPSR